MRILLIATCWLLVIAFSLSRVAHAPALPPQSDASSVAFATAVDHLSSIAAEIHPVGSAAHARVQAYIEAEIAALGLEADVQTTPVAELTGEPQWAAGGTVSNIITSIKGRRSDKAVLVAGHYDSHPASYGAADAGATVASMLALLAVLRDEPMPANDIIFLFTDGEEPCLCGARAFVSEHPRADDVGVVINFEARGTGGPSVMFETSSGNGALISHYAAAARHPVTSSLYYEIYKVLPNNTDFTVFRVAGMPGINFAFVGEYRNYHNADDSVANLDENTFFHQFTNMETMLRQFAAADLDSLEAPDLVFFDVLSLFVVQYSPGFAIMLAAVCIALYIPLVFWQLRDGSNNKPLRMLWSLPAWLMLCAAIAWFAAMLASIGLPDVDDSAYRAGATSNLRVLFLVALTGGLFAAALQLAARLFSPGQLALPIAGLWLIVLVTMLFVAPGASHLFTWPLLFVLTGMHLHRIARLEKAPVGWRLLIFTLMPMPLFIMWTQLVYAIFLALTLQASLLIAAILLFALSLLTINLLWAWREKPHMI